MRDPLGLSIYLSTLARQRPALEQLRGGSAPVFLSLHMSEEFGADYSRRAEEVCRELSGAGFRVIADVSKKTVEQFGEPDMAALAGRLGLWAVRLDYGFTPREALGLSQRVPVVLNASTVPVEEAARVAAGGGRVLAMHNFYPRPETGLDRDFLLERTRALQGAGLEVLAFVPGDAELRGPLHLGLPTLEEHRGVPPSAAYADLVTNFSMDGVFAGDPGVSEQELARVRRFSEDGVWELPAVLNEPYGELYGKVFTCRADSPARLIRFAESREYSCFGGAVPPAGCAPRPRGAVTVDNEGYGRYSGEIQLARSDLPADSRVNVIGRLCPGYELLADCIRGGQRFALVPRP